MFRDLLPRLAVVGRRHYRVVFAIFAILVVLSLAAASRLRFDTDVMNLLPRESQEVDTFRRALEEFGSVDYLLVAVRLPEGVPLDPYEGLVDRLGERLAGLDGLRRVEYRIGEIDELVTAFLPRALLFLDDGERRRVLARLDDEALVERAREIRRLVSMPQAMVLEELWKLDPLGLADIFLDRLTATRAGLSLDWASGYLLSRDHRMLLLLGRPEHTPENVEYNRVLIDAVESEIAAALASWPELVGGQPLPAPDIVLGGRYVIALGDEKLIRKDMAINIATSMIGVLLLFLFAFRRFGPLLYAFLPLASGLLFTFGFAMLALGELNSATSGVAALLIGLGIDFVIVSYGRFVEERQAGASLEEGLARMNGSSGRAVVVGGVTSAATFYAFGVTEFTGLRQMGFLTGTGILFCMVAVVLLLPALLAWGEDRYSRRRSFPRLFLHGFGTSRLIRLCLAAPRAVLAIGAAVTLVAGWLALGLEFEDSVTAMRPAGNPGVLVREEVGRHFGSGFDQMMLVVRGQSLDAVLERADVVAAGARRLVEAGVLTGYDSVSNVLPSPSRQRQALDWMAEHRAALDPASVRERFAAALAAEGMRETPFVRGLDLLVEALSRTDPVTAAELAATEQAGRLLERYLYESAEGWATVVYLYPPRGRWRREPPPEAVALAAELGPDVELTGANVVSAYLRQNVLGGARLASVIGTLLVAFLLWLDYRRIGDTLLTLAPLLVGIVWMLGAMVVLGLTMNFMNIFVTTMIIGIGVDYGVHMIHRRRELQDAPPKVLEAGMLETGKAIALAALSTMVGFGSMSLSHYPGLRSMGFVSILGAVATALVAITMLPAYLVLRSRRRAARSERVAP